MPSRLRFFLVPPLLAAAAWLLAARAFAQQAQRLEPMPFNLNLQATPTPAPTATPPPDKRYVPPKVIKRGAVTYPILANLNRIQGRVGVRFSIDENGKVTNAIVYQTSRSLMLDAVVKSQGMMDWTFQPATLDGKPVPSELEQNFEFQLDPAEQRQFAHKRLAAPLGTPDPPYPKEALAIQPHPRGDCTIGVFWTNRGLVDNINLLKSSGSKTLDHAALLFAYENWRVDPKGIKDFKEQFTKVLTFTPPDDGSGTPAPLASATPTPTPTATPTPTPAPTATPKTRRGH